MKRVLLVFTLLVSFCEAGTPRVLSDGHDDKVPEVDLDNLALSNQSLIDLFKCKAILMYHSYQAFHHGYPTRHLEESNLKQWVARAGNRKGESFAIQTGLPVKFGDKAGFLIRQGDKTFFVDTPTVKNKSSRRYEGSVHMPGAQPTILSVEMEPENPFTAAHEQRFDSKWDYPLSVKPLQDNDRGMIEFLQRLFDKEVEAQVGPYLVTGIYLPNFGKNNEDFIDFTDHLLLRMGPPASVLRRLEACRSAMHPHNQQLLKLIEFLTSHKITWETNYEAAKRIKHAADTLKEIRDEVRTTQRKDAVDPKDLPFKKLEPGLEYQ